MWSLFFVAAGHTRQGHRLGRQDAIQFLTGQEPALAHQLAD
jgi:hypothetical protein